MKLLFLGDVVGRSGREAVDKYLPSLIADFNLDFVVINGENAAGGFGITEDIYMSLLDAGADVVTTGNHVWNQSETRIFSTRHDNFLRPLNFPAGTPGKGATLATARNGARILVMNAQGRIFMTPMDDPFIAVDKELDAAPLAEVVDATVIDFHAEATSEKQIMGHYVDGRASLVVGTHTHTPTSDTRVLPGGTAFMTDAGMCGDYDSVIGMDKEEPINRMLTGMNSGRFTPAANAGTISGVSVLISERTGLAEKVEPVRKGPGLAEHIPSFW